MQLYQGDCLEVMKQIPDKSVDCVITDPPYSTPTISSFGRQLVKKASDLSIQETFRLKKEAIKYKNSHPNQFLIIKPIYIY